MKDRIIKGTVTLIILIVLTAVAVVAYFMIAEIETKVIPNENTYTCNIEQKKFMNRNVFILTPKNVENTKQKNCRKPRLYLCFRQFWSE